jgi:hypothetical protein
MSATAAGWASPSWWVAKWKGGRKMKVIDRLLWGALAAVLFALALCVLDLRPQTPNPEPKVTLCELDGHIWLYPDPQPTDIVVEGAEFPTGPGDVEYWQCRVCKKWRVVPLGCK